MGGLRLGMDELEPGLRRILAPNPSPMTFRGTNSYLVGRGAGLALIDPGPDDPAHLAAILSALHPGEHISHILVTHGHRDHSALAPGLARMTGAPVLAFGPAAAGRSARMKALALSGSLPGGEGVDGVFAPDILLPDGGRVEGDGWRIEALHTPGHFGNHLCFHWGKAIFSGDHVMGWSSTVIAPPDGDMAAYMQALDRLARRGAARLYPGHGDPVTDPARRIAELIRHRRARAEAVLAALSDSPASAAMIAGGLYRDTPPALLGAAALNVLAQLIDFMDRNICTALGPLHPTTLFRRL